VISMTRAESVRRHERTILKGIFLVSLLVLIVLGSTVLVIRVLRTNPRGDIPTTGWQRTPEIRIVMDSTADWARIMFNDLYGTDLNGLRIVEFHAHGWLMGNDSDDRIDVGRGLTFLDVIYNRTVVKTGDIIGFFKGNNDFRHTKMFADIVLDMNMDMTSVSVYLMLAGAGATIFQFINKESGTVIWQDMETGRSVTQYTPRSMSPQAFFAKEKIDAFLVLALVLGSVVTIAVLNLAPFGRLAEAPLREDAGGL